MDEHCIKQMGIDEPSQCSSLDQNNVSPITSGDDLNTEVIILFYCWLPEAILQLGRY